MTDLNSAYIVTSNETENQTRPAIRMDDVLAVIKSKREDVLALRTHAGLHRLDTDKKRFERWEITAAKLYALNLVESDVFSLPPAPVESDDLLFHKLNSSMFRDWLVKRIDALKAEFAEADLLSNVADVRSGANLTYRNINALIEVLKTFDDLGNAGEQPKDKEKEAQPMGTPPVTVAPQLSELIAILLNGTGVWDASMLVMVSEWCLDQLASLEGEHRWQAADTPPPRPNGHPFAVGLGSVEAALEGDWVDNF
jgi:hypothetical protein